MKESKLKASNGKVNTSPVNTQRPWVHDPQLQHQIEEEAHLRAKNNGFRSSAHFYLLAAARDFGCVAA